MREQILKLVQAKPFIPFIVDVAEDVSYVVPTPDDIFPASPRLLVIMADDGYVNVIPYDHIRRLVFKERGADV
ncbi:MAG TPA: hypothetical protein VIT91_09650 [Chthoniobacterales bacterium]